MGAVLFESMIDVDLTSEKVIRGAEIISTSLNISKSILVLTFTDYIDIMGEATRNALIRRRRRRP